MKMLHFTAHDINAMLSECMHHNDSPEQISLNFADGIYIHADDIPCGVVCFALGFDPTEDGASSRQNKLSISGTFPLDYHQLWNAKSKNGVVSLAFDEIDNTWAIAPQTSGTLDPFQQFIVRHYPDGESLIQSTADIKTCGDGLLTYLLLECSVSEGAESVDEFRGRLEKSADQIQQLLGEIQRMNSL